MGRGFQAVQRGVAPGSERRMASLATERLDVLGLAVLAIADERTNVRISDPEVRALWVGTGEALCVHALGCSPPAFDLTPGTYRTRIWPLCWLLMISAEQIASFPHQLLVCSRLICSLRRLGEYVFVILDTNSVTLILIFLLFQGKSQSTACWIEHNNTHES